MDDRLRIFDIDDNAIIHTTAHSPIWSSLLSGLQSPLAVDRSTISKFVITNNPRRVREMKDTALYWVDEDGSPLVIKFPVLLDTEGIFGAIGPYFNLEKVRWSYPSLHFYFIYLFFSTLQQDSVFEENTLKRTKAIFEFRPLPVNEDLFPKTATDCYLTAFELLSVLTTELETERNNGLSFFRYFASSSSLIFPQRCPKISMGEKVSFF
jgi:hypothetical protein